MSDKVKWRDAKALRSRNEELEAKLAKAVEGLEELASGPRESSIVIGDWWAYYNDTIIYARALLAELKEEGKK